MSTDRARDGSDVVIVDIIRALGFALLERQPSQRFRLLAAPPGWFHVLFSTTELEIDRSLVRERSPFLEEFLPVADAFWSNRSDGLLRSGPWQETNEQGETFRLEATAAFVSSRQLLMISAVNRATDDETAILQRARETGLQNESLTRRLNAAESTLRGVSANLRESLAAIHAFVEMVEPRPDSGDHMHRLDAAKRSITRMNALIDVLARQADPL